MAEDLMRYDLMTREAKRGLMREVLRRVAKDGLVGAHHFYISFRTPAPGVELADQLRNRYPNEMTIVLQHRFWGLEVSEDGFTVEVEFNKVPQRLTIPFAAVTDFFDPSVRFGLQFPAGDGAPAAENQPAAPIAEETDMTPAGPKIVNIDAFRKK